jgi:hypothetical protein
MKIGKRERTIIVEPIRVPVPAPERPIPEEEARPKREPIRSPKREPVPA